MTSWDVFPGHTSEAKVRWKDLCWSVGQSTVSMSSHQRSEGRGVTKSLRATLRPWMIVYSVHLEGEKILKLRPNEDVVFLSGGKCDTPDLALKND